VNRRLLRGASESSGFNLSSPATSCNGKKVLVTKVFAGSKWFIFRGEESLYRKNPSNFLRNTPDPQGLRLQVTERSWGLAGSGFPTKCAGIFILTRLYFHRQSAIWVGFCSDCCSSQRLLLDFGPTVSLFVFPLPRRVSKTKHSKKWHQEPL
jgi:hypothetical protein